MIGSFQICCAAVVVVVVMANKVCCLVRPSTHKDPIYVYPTPNVRRNVSERLIHFEATVDGLETWQRSLSTQDYLSSTHTDKRKNIWYSSDQELVEQSSESVESFQNFCRTFRFLSTSFYLFIYSCCK